MPRTQWSSATSIIVTSLIILTVSAQVEAAPPLTRLDFVPDKLMIGSMNEGRPKSLSSEHRSL